MAHRFTLLETAEARAVLLIVVTVGAVSSAHGATPLEHRPHGAPPARHTTRNAARPASAAVTPSRPVRAEEISIRTSRRVLNGGGGMMRIEHAPRSVQTVDREYIAMRNPSSTALDLIQNLPSVSISTPDPYGMQGGQIQTRGLTDLDMALLLDGAPAAAAKYITENIDTENLESVSLTPGSSETALPVMSAAAGTMNEQSHTPARHFGGLVDFSYGTNNLSREFMRVDTGEIGHTGVRGFFSFSNTHARSWMGAGINERRHIDFGLNKTWDNGSYARTFVSWNWEDFTIDNYPTAQEFYLYKHTGQGYGRSADSGNINYWKNNTDYWNQVFLSAPVHIVLPHRFTFDIQAYYNLGRGWDASPGGVETQPDGASRNVTSYFLQGATERRGAVAKLGYDLDRHNHVALGYWYENNYTAQSYPTSYTMANGAAPSPNAAAYRIDAGDQQNAGYEIHSLFVEDRARYLQDRLEIEAGFKFVMANTWNKDLYGRMSNNRTEPLPQLSVGYTIDSHSQIYMNAEGDYRQPSAVDLGWLYTSMPIPKNQYSIKEEIGYRYHDRYVIFDASFFNYNVTNRIVNQYLGMNQFRPFSIGNQHMRGFDVMLSGRSYHGISPYASVEYLHAVQDSDVLDPYSGALLPSRGTQAIMAPRVLANFGVTYKYAGFFSNASLHYTGPQSVSVAGDQRIPGFVTNTISLGYRFHPVGIAQSPTFKLNFANVTGSIVRTGAMGAIYSARDPSTVYSGSLAPYTGYGNSFMTNARFSMTGTVSTQF
ncbi:TonB-dependent receptor [Swaminathania salitolerans]|uniref:Ligand-gated channel n=1 Tax=Swaminathania salitolerans TaxID=182838 RepID=A0A511BSB8_9PROT|nr:TonB-dependent receptor plug domain-containing protein [Swaminathania salitolerans]GBQ12942.1 TonB-dependent receptor [Swaminathania salitolerans LMG 21291]GEL03221.1 ligand-gated channel [Swaminathania salitolerans]